MKQPQLNPTSEHDRISHTMKSIGRDLIVIHELLHATDDDQWQRPPTRTTGEVDRRPQGGYNDPVGDTVMNTRRQRLRHDRKRSVKDLDRVASQVRGIAGGLERSHNHYKGLHD